MFATPVAPLVDVSRRSSVAQTIVVDRWLEEIWHPAPLPPDFPVESQNQIDGGFLAWLRPLIYRAYRQLSQAVENALTQAGCPFTPFDATTATTLALPNLLSRLEYVILQTLVFELRLARLQGGLQGPTPEARYQDFIRQLHTPAFAARLISDYPLLADRLITLCQQWVTVQEEMFTRLILDWPRLQSTFQLSPIDRLIAIEGNQGDTHQGGRCVAVLLFASGRRLVYKPRSQAGAVRFQAFLTWVNQLGVAHPFRTLYLVDGDGYGWVEYVTPQPCSSPQAVERFYWRQGGLLAILYVLYATDIHHENLIAAGEQPIVVDLESLFHPFVFGVKRERPIDNLMVRGLLDSVKYSQLLPQRQPASGLDQGAMGASAHQVARNVLQLCGQGTDEMRFERAPLPFRPGRHRPTLHGQPIEVLEYVAMIEAGFEAVYALLERHKDGLLREGGWLDAFQNDEIRVVMRDTTAYTLLLRQSNHPIYLGDVEAAQRNYDRLWVEVAKKPHLEPLIAHEIAELQRLDVPLFTTYPHSRHLWMGQDVCWPNYLSESGLHSARQVVTRLGPADLERQLWFIRASFACLVEDLDHPAMPRYTPALDRVSDRPPDWRAAVMAVADYIISQRLESADGCVTWLSLNRLEQGYWDINGMSTSLFDGQPGLMFFFAYAGHILAEERYTRLAQAILRNVSYWFGETPDFPITSLGGFNGLGGAIYALAHLQAVWGEAGVEAWRLAEELARRVPALLTDDRPAGMDDGVSGCLLALLALAAGGSQIARQSAGQCASWLQKRLSDAPAGGWGQDRSEAAHALLQWGQFTANTTYMESAIALLRQDALDVLALSRPPSGQAINGLMRRALAWLAAAQVVDGAPELQQGVSYALQRVLEIGLGHNHSLAYGDLGRLDFLFIVCRERPAPELVAVVAEHIAAMTQPIAEGRWLCGTPFGVATPGLMTGLAGIGYQLLRLAACPDLPSLLRLSPPRFHTPAQPHESGL